MHTSASGRVLYASSVGLKDAGKFVAAAVLVLVAGQAARVIPRPSSSEAVTEDRIISKSMDSASELEPHMAATRKGDVAVAWMGVRGGKDGREPTHIGARVSHDQGQTWGPIVRIDSPDRDRAEDPSVTFFQGEPTVTWLGSDAVYSARIGESPVVVAKGALDSTILERPTSVSGGDRLWVAYATQRPGKGEVVTRIELASSADGRVFLNTNVAGDGAQPTVCASGHTVLVAWINGAEVMVAASDDWAKTFTRFVASGANEHVAAETPSCVVDGDDVWISYGASDAVVVARPDVKQSALMDFAVVTHSHDSGKTTFDRANVRPGGKVMHPTLALRPSGALDLVYLTGGADGDKAGRAATHRVVAGSAAKLPRTIHEPVIFASAMDDPAWAGDYFGVASTDKTTLAALTDTRLEITDAGGSGVERHIVIAAIPEE